MTPWEFFQMESIGGELFWQWWVTLSVLGLAVGTFVHHRHKR